MRALLLAGLALAGCAAGTTVVDVSVTASGTLGGIDHFVVTVVDSAHGRTSKPIDVKLASPPVTLPPAQKFALVLPASVDGSVALDVNAADAQGAVIASGTTTVAVKPSGTFSATLTLPGTMTVADMSTGGSSDLSSVDLATTPPADLTRGPDLYGVVEQLLVTKSGNMKGLVAGSGISCGATCSASVAPGAMVTLTASSPPGSAAWFTGWGGVCSGTQPTCTFAMPLATVNVTASFVAANYVFVTNPAGAAIKTPLGNTPAAALTAADNICTTRANAAGLPGHYVAFLSVTGTNAISRMGSARGWIRPDGLPVFDLPTDIYPALKMYYPIILDEVGGNIAGPASQVATGSNATGQLFSGSNCSDWSATTGAFTVGWPYREGTSWMYTNFGGTCGMPMVLYCFGTDNMATITPPKTPGRVMFVSTGWDPTTGISAANALCMSLAKASSLPGSSTADSYRALLTLPTQSMSQSLAPLGTATFVRPDGIPVVANAADLFTTKPLLAPPSQQADGSYHDWFAWTGVPGSDPTAPGSTTTTCGGAWASSAGTSIGGSNVDTLLWFNYGGGTAACNRSDEYVYCAQR